MSHVLLGQQVVSKVVLRSAPPGSRAVFLVEAQNRRERRQIHELFETVGELADVAQLSEGEIMSYAVQVQDDPSLFGKVEALLKSQFCFTIVERSFGEVIYRLVESLCEDSQSRLLPLPLCGICAAPDPFPTRISIVDERGHEIAEGAYCVRCAARQADRSPEKFLTDLLAADQRGLAALRDARLVACRRPASESPLPVDDRVQTYAVAS